VEEALKLEPDDALLLPEQVLILERRAIALSRCTSP
jgi:hypothetical protein